MGADRSQRVRWLERVLLVIGVMCLGYYGYQTTEARNFQREQAAAFEARLESNARAAAEERVEVVEDLRDSTALSRVASSAASVLVANVPARRALPSDDARLTAGKAISRSSMVMAMLEIPRLELSSAIVPGDDADVLDIAVGHLPDTPKPWERGNSALAAHRDGLFRPLEHIRVGDEVRVRAEHGEFVYRVRETKVVMPDDLSVLAATSADTLTLITCYPFNFIGRAPKRFIVHADRVASAPIKP